MDPQLLDAQWDASQGAKVEKEGDCIYSIQTSPGDWVTLATRTSPPKAVGRPRRPARQEAPLWVVEE